MAAILRSRIRAPDTFDLVEAGAGNGRLAADILRAARAATRRSTIASRLHLVEASAEARRRKWRRWATSPTGSLSSAPSCPSPSRASSRQRAARRAAGASGRHARGGLREVYVTAASSRPTRRRTTKQFGSLRSLRVPLDAGARRIPPRLGVSLEPGWRAEINLRAVEWVRDAARRLRRGFIILIDYGHEARELYSASHAGGTLTTFARHTASAPKHRPVRRLAAVAGRSRHHGARRFHQRARSGRSGRATTLGSSTRPISSWGSCRQSAIRNQSAINNQQIRNLKTLMMPGGLGSTHKVSSSAKASVPRRCAAAHFRCASHEALAPAARSP